MSVCHVLALILLAVPAQAQQKPGTMGAEGIWEGKLTPGNINLRLAFKITRKPDGTLQATMDSVDQGAKDIPIEKATFADGKLTLEMAKLKATYDATLSGDGATLKGDFKQAGMTFPLELKRVEKLSTLDRPQLPKKPYPYVEEEVVFENKLADVKLAGTLTRPQGPGPFPVAIMITGSGPQDRDESLMGHKPFLVIADHLTRKGIAVLRFDDRGVGKSTGKHNTATSADFATDVTAGIAFLKARKDIDPKKIGLIGHSEGGLIAPMVAAEPGHEVAFIVLLAGPGLPGDEILVAQGQLLMKASGADQKALAFQRETQKRLLDMAKAGADEAKFKAVSKEILDKLTEEDRKKMGPAGTSQLEQASTILTRPWFRYFLTYDPRPALQKVRCPVLALNGEKDLQVPCRENLEVIEKTVKAGGNTDVTTREFAGLNHLFQTCKTGGPSEYGIITETFAPAVLEFMSDWILKRVTK